jgi:predicted ferric reductase
MKKIIHSPVTQYFILGISLLLPFILWLGAPHINPRFDSLAEVLASTGEVAGILGTVLFSITIILSMRPRILESLLGGINKLYIKHSRLGQIAFVLLLMHPLLLLARYAQDIQGAVTFFTIGSSLQQDLGIIAIVLMIFTIVLTLYIRPRYSIWRNIHKLLGVALFLGALHIYLSPSYVLSNSILLLNYVLGLAAIAIGFWVYKSILGMVFTKRYKYTVKEVTKLNDSIIEIEMQAENTSGSMVYNAGQFIFIKFLQQGISKESHPFSLVSAPCESNLKVSVKVLGDYTAALYNKLDQWSGALVEGPFGLFSYKKVNKARQVWIAGGVGITPFVSMAKDLVDTPGSYDVSLYYAVRNEHEAVYLSLLQSVADKVSGFRVIPFYSEDRGFITANYIASDIKDIKERDVLLCAPPVMIHSLKVQFMDIGLDSHQLYSEEFNL